MSSSPRAALCYGFIVPDDHAEKARELIEEHEGYEKFDYMEFDDEQQWIICLKSSVITVDLYDGEQLGAVPVPSYSYTSMLWFEPLLKALGLERSSRDFKTWFVTNYV